MKKILGSIAALVVFVLSIFGIMRVTASGPPPADGICPDFTGDHRVLIPDIVHVVDLYFTSDPQADLDRDGQVRIVDILKVLQHYFETCAFPTPISTPFDFAFAGGSVPPEYPSHADYASDWLDDHMLNHSSGDGGSGGIWVNVGCEVSALPDCVVPSSSQIIISSDGSVEVVLP